MISSIVFLAAFALFLAGASPTVSFEDTGELIWAADCLGITHPPGYPWLTMLGALFLRIPLGDPGFCMSLLSATFAAAAVVLVFATVRIVAARAGLNPLLPSVVSALALAFSRTLWWQAGIADKYPLSLFLLALTVYFLLRAWTKRDGASLPAAALFLGISISHHLHGLYLVPLALAALIRLWPGLPKAVLLAFLFSIPLAGKAAVIPIRAAANPALNWTAPDTAKRLSRYIAARQYRAIMFSAEGGHEFAQRALRQATEIPLGEFGPCLAWAAPGLAVLRAVPGMLPAVGLIFGTNYFLALAYNTPEIERYYLLSFYLLAAMAGLGAGSMARFSKCSTIAVFAALLLPFLVNSRTSLRNRHYLAYDFAVNQLASLPRNAMLICEGDDQAFPLFFIHEVAGYRPDVVILPMPFACTPAGYVRLRKHLVSLAYPPFEPNPGIHIPRIIRANERRHPAFYTPGCSGAGSESHLVPHGIVFRAFADPEKAAEYGDTAVGFPRLRLRGCVTAGRYEDVVTLRAVANYAFGYAYHGARNLQAGDAFTAAKFLRMSLRFPVLREEIHAAALTHLGLACWQMGEPEQAERHFRLAVDRFPSFGPALFSYAEFLLNFRGDDPRIARLLSQAMLSPEFLTQAQRAKARRLLPRSH